MWQTKLKYRRSEGLKLKFRLDKVHHDKMVAVLLLNMQMDYLEIPAIPVSKKNTSGILTITEK